MIISNVLDIFWLNDNPLQYSCLENPLDTGDWWATAQRITKSQTGLK